MILLLVLTEKYGNVGKSYDTDITAHGDRGATKHGQKSQTRLSFVLNRPSYIHTQKPTQHVTLREKATGKAIWFSNPREGKESLDIWNKYK